MKKINARLTFFSRGSFSVMDRLNEKLSEVFLVNLSLIFLGQLILSAYLRDGVSKTCLNEKIHIQFGHQGSGCDLVQMKLL